MSIGTMRSLTTMFATGHYRRMNEHVPTADSVRKVLRLPPELWKEVRAYRFEAQVDSENATFVRLIRAGLEAESAPELP